MGTIGDNQLNSFSGTGTIGDRILKNLRVTTGLQGTLDDIGGSLGLTQTVTSFTAQSLYEGQTILSVDLTSFFSNGADGFAVTSGALPSGITISGTTLVGSPSASGSFSAEITGTNSGDSSTQANTFDFTVSDWFSSASVAWGPSSADVSSGAVTTFSSLTSTSETLTYRAGNGKATISSGVVSFTEANEPAYTSAVGSSQLGGGNSFGQIWSGYTTSSSANFFTFPILRGTSSVGADYLRFDFDANSLQVDPLLKGTSYRAGRDADETDVLSQNDKAAIAQWVDGDEWWAFYQGLPILYDRTDATGTVLADPISDNQTAIIGHVNPTSGRAFTGEFYGAAELREADSPTPTDFATTAGAISGLSGNYVTRPGVCLVSIGNSIQAGSIPSHWTSSPETVDVTRGFSVYDLTTDNTQYFSYDIRGPISHYRAEDWATTTAYVRGDFSFEAGQTYYCLQDHTSGTFATDLAANKWIAITGRNSNLGGWGASNGFRGAIPAGSSAAPLNQEDNNIAKADPNVYLLNRVVSDSEAFVVYANVTNPGASLTADTANVATNTINYWLSDSDHSTVTARTSLWDTYIGQIQKVYEVADITPAMHSVFRVLAVGNLGVQEARGGSSYSVGTNAITPAEYKTYLQAFINRAFSVLNLDMILYQPTSEDLSYVNAGDTAIFDSFRAIEEEVEAENTKFILGCPGHIKPGVNPRFTTDANGAWATSVPSGGTQIYIGTPGIGDQLHFTASYHVAEGRFNATLLLNEWHRQLYGA
jgi:hypothetical protein